MSILRGIKGTKNHVIIAFPLPNGSEAMIALNVLAGMGTSLSYKGGREHAKNMGVPDEQAKEGQPDYDLGMRAHVLFHSATKCSRKEVPKSDENPEGVEWVRTDEPAFDSPEEILTEIDDEVINYAYGVYHVFRDTCSTQIQQMSPENINKFLAVMGNPEVDDKVAIPFYGSFKQGFVFRLLRTMANPQWVSLMSRSGSGTASSNDAGEAERGTDSSWPAQGSESPPSGDSAPPPPTSAPAASRTKSSTAASRRRSRRGSRK